MFQRSHRSRFEVIYSKFVNSLVLLKEFKNSYSILLEPALRVIIASVLRLSVKRFGVLAGSVSYGYSNKPNQSK
jgi:hypothetical protein